MSARTEAALVTALQEHISDEGDQTELVVSWVIAAHTTILEESNADRHSYEFFAQVHQPIHVTIGLIDLADDWARSTGLHYEGDD